MKIYKSKVSWGILLFPMLLFWGIIAFMMVKGEAPLAILTTFLIFLVVGLYILYVLITTEYVIDKEKLYVKCGFVYRKHLDISRIQSVKRTNVLISAPAASLDRLYVKYDEYSGLIISPRDKEDFVKDLLKINPNIIDKVTT